MRKGLMHPQGHPALLVHSKTTLDQLYPSVCYVIESIHTQLCSQKHFWKLVCCKGELRHTLCKLTGQIIGKRITVLNGSFSSKLECDVVAINPDLSYGMELSGHWSSYLKEWSSVKTTHSNTLETVSAWANHNFQMQNACMYAPVAWATML